MAVMAIQVVSMEVKKRDWTRDELLQNWGLRITGQSFGDPAKLFNKCSRSGDKTGMDDELQAVMFLENIKGFMLARPVLRHLFVDLKPLSAFRLMLPGEPLQNALERQGWLKVEGWSDPRDIPAIVYRSFVVAIDDELRVRPFRPLPPLAEKDANEIAAEVSGR